MRNCELIVLLLTALACGPECWSLSKDGGTESHDTQEHRLGPDHELEEGKCNVFETGGNLLPESKPNEQLDHGGGPGEDGDEKVFEIIEKPVHQSAFSFAASTVTHITNKIYNGASNVASDFAEKAKSKIYNGATNVASDFAEKVREVFHEEMYGFLESLFGKVGDMIFSPGTILHSLSIKAMTVGLVILCIIFIYLFWNYFTFFFLLAFICFVCLVHHFMGPKWIFSQLIWAGGYVYSILHLMMAHLYITFVTIVVLFLASIIIPIVRWTTRRTSEQRIEKIERNVQSLIDMIEKIEHTQEEMLRILQAMDPNRPNANSTP